MFFYILLTLNHFQEHMGVWREEKKRKKLMFCMLHFNICCPCCWENLTIACGRHAIVKFSQQQGQQMSLFVFHFCKQMFIFRHFVNCMHQCGYLGLACFLFPSVYALYLLNHENTMNTFTACWEEEETWNENDC